MSDLLQGMLFGTLIMFVLFFSTILRKLDEIIKHLEKKNGPQS